ncbi:MAG: response regulator [Chloroflexi bacterium]|nr:response regulator [Chloroflexota bacterium]
MDALHILLVEDDEIDAEVILRGFRCQGFEPLITLAQNGLEALALLRDPLARPHLGHPHVILTDINMPLMNGLELLQVLRDDPNLRRSVVFVLSGSALEVDRRAAYAQQVAGYLLKADLEQNLPQLTRLLACYGSIVQFPAELNVQTGAPSVAVAVLA